MPTATYRLQLHKHFPFAAATAIVSYLHALGVSDAYVSPILQARPDSPHGYDICDHGHINPDLGGEAALDEFAAALRAHDMGLLVDTVPNHMGINHPSNGWWTDVLENGPASRFAHHFDIDWAPVNPDLKNKVLIPILGDQYGQVLESGKLRLTYDDGAFFLTYYDHRLPVAPKTSVSILEMRLAHLATTLGEHHEHVEELRSILTALRHLPPRMELPPEAIEERYREKAIVRRRIRDLAAASPAVQAAIVGSLETINGMVGVPETFDALDALVEGQSYRPAFWRVATEEINYRRFFDINDLAAIRPEVPAVFEATHRVLLRLLAAGKVTGLRIDHPDGLWQPAAYFRAVHHAYTLAAVKERYRGQRTPEQLANETASALTAAATASDPPTYPLYLVAEKILSEDEPLPAAWAVDGTTGYDFLNVVNGLFVVPDNRQELERVYHAVTSQTIDVHQLVLSTKRTIMLMSMASEINSLSHQLDRLAERSRLYRDFTLNSLTIAVREVIATLPIYRTYIVGGEPVSPRDRHFIEQTVEHAKDRNPATPEAVFDFVRDTLLMRNLARFREEDRPRVVEWVLRFQQLSGPVMAKGVEDTAFYIHNRLVSLNDVGAPLDAFGVSLEEFHAHNGDRAARWPHTLLATSTHDTKRSEDVRARINVLSELPDEWERAVTAWREMHREHVGQADGRPAPSANDQYLFYQTLVGAWPAEPLDAEGLAGFRARVSDYMLKAIKEAKVHTSWVNPNEEYDAATRAFVAGVLGGDAASFRASLEPFQRRIAHFGYLNSLAQVVLKLTSPGVPDVYQGCEMWDFSLVDPDNRRPVDHELRRQALANLENASPAELIGSMADGRIKLYVTWRTLHLRRERPALFAGGDYRPLAATGRHPGSVCAFSRTHDAESVVVAVCRHIVGLTSGEEKLPVGEAVWADARLLVEEPVGTTYRDVYTGECVVVAERDGQAGLGLHDVLATLPFALLRRVSRDEEPSRAGN